MTKELINEVSYKKHLNIFLSSDGTWHEHINNITSKAWSMIYMIIMLKAEILIKNHFFFS